MILKIATMPFDSYKHRIRYKIRVHILIYTYGS